MRNGLGLCVISLCLTACEAFKNQGPTIDTAAVGPTPEEPSSEPSEETDTEETDTEETDTEEVVDQDGDGVSVEDGDCDDSNPEIFPGAFDNPENEIDEDCNGTPAKIVDFADGLINPSFEESPDAWKNLGSTFAVQSSTDNMFGDEGDSGVAFAAPDGDKFVKIWPDMGANLYGDESPVYQEWFATENNLSDQTFYISAWGLVHESSLLKGLTEAAVFVKCFDSDWNSTGKAQSVALKATSSVNEWAHLSALGTCGPETNAVQAFLSLQTPDEDVDGDGIVDPGESQRTGNVYFDNVKFGVYSN